MLMEKLFSVSSSWLSSLPKSKCQKITLQFLSSGPTQSKNVLPSDSLFRRISRLGDPNISMVPVLDKWISDGNSVDKPLLQSIIKELKFYNRFKHAIEVSEWMTDKRNFDLESTDVAMRMNLIFKVHGLEQVENYYYNLNQNLKYCYNAHIALLDCYSRAKSADKAEALMQKARDMGHAVKPIWYNIMMNLYLNLGNYEKVGCLMDEMEKNGVHYDQFTLIICLKAYTMVADTDGIDKIVKIMESDPRIIPSWNLYSVAANGYLRVGLKEKALTMMNKVKILMEKEERKDVACAILFKLYAEGGNKDDLYQIWNEYKRNNKLTNKVYKSMMLALLKCDHVEGVEVVFEEWETSGLSYDFRIPNLLIDAYCRNGNLEKAIALLNRGKSRGGSPNAMTWRHLACAYIKDNQIVEAINSLKKAISLCPPSFTESMETLIACREYLEGGNNMDMFISSLPQCISSLDVLNKLCCFIKTGELPSHSGAVSGKDVHDEDEKNV
ncbi:hypothetical protein ACJIZ3_006389 [Penstemon smallii]|uniref:Pentatricopeptide repeat-containing protein n=1 Tax=Penstemon smallii TaxID=265156 RepID=A0ABD3S7Q0_9LAMI